MSVGKEDKQTDRGHIEEEREERLVREVKKKETETDNLRIKKTKT